MGVGCGSQREPGPVVEASFMAQDEPAPRSLSGFRGRVVVIGFWTSGCLQCDEQLSILNRLAGKYGSAGLVCIGLYAAGEEFSMPGLAILHGAVDSNQAALLPRERPALLVLDREGRQVEKFDALVDEERLEKLLRPLLGV